MIYAYSINGKFKQCKKLYDLMKNDIGLSPNERIYILLINACSHSGLVNDALTIWNVDLEMHDDIKFDSYVVNSIVYCLANKNYINKALELVYKYEQYCDGKFDDNYYVIWTSLLHGCNKSKNQLMAKYVLNEIRIRFANVQP
eukprot:527273_1